jgi:hypothetical protein|tara:strand:+ start:1900 stop:2046 length:147 start_codon:yes stop_codon:yes gene_type:complete
MPYNDKPVKQYGKPEPVMAKGYLKMSGKIEAPALLMKCGSKRKMGKKK